MTRLPFVLVLLTAAVWTGSRAGDASGCGAVPRPGQRVDTADEAAYIVWDEKTKTEHFIRRATFNSTSADFGFLVPTPNRPELDVADEHLFGTLASVTAAKYEYREVVVEVDREFGFGCMPRDRFTRSEAVGAADKAPASRAPGGVEVLEQKRVGDYDATVLVFRRGGGEDAATGAAELTKWLAKHGYQSSPALAKWLERYVQDEWCMTAFKIASNAKRDGGPPTFNLQAKPIRMSFKTERPFYPYREPETEAPAGGPTPRLLRVFLAAPARFAGKLGDGTKAWPGQTVWSGPLNGSYASALFKSAKLGTGAAPDDQWLTEFEDRSSPRPGTDEVYFERDADPSPVARPPHIITTTREVMVTPWWHGAVYFGAPAALVVFGLLLWRVLRRM